MRITTTLFTVIGALSALTSSSVSASSGVLSPGQHLSMLQKRTHGGHLNGVNAHHQHSHAKKRAATTPPKTPTLKKRGNGYCKPKPKPSPPAAPSKDNNDDDNKPSTQAPPPPPPSSSKQQQSQPKPTQKDDDNKDDGKDNNNNNNNGGNNGGGSGTANAQLGSISAFQGSNSGIMSWSKTNLGSDSTNGMSWCQTRYQDDWMCFAPSVGTMLKNFNYDYVTAAKHYCGREVTVTYNGNSVNAFICDGFDDRWVRSAGSIDATVGLFKAVYGSFDGNKNTVGQGVQWSFTGGVVQQGTFQHNKYN